MKKVIMSLCLLGTCLANAAESRVNLIPQPAEMTVSDDKGADFTINRYTALRCETDKPEFVRQTEMLRTALNKGTWLNVSGYRTQKDNVIIVREDPALTSLGEEAYRLSVTKNEIILSASNPKGIFYAGQTLTQLLDTAFFVHGYKSERDWTVPSCQITDYPRFSWRALHFDESRHFFGEVAAKQVIDQMALMKMNILHWHLTNDAGWRIEIKKYPRLTEVGSKRDDSEIGTWGSGKSEGKPYQAFYTQEQIKDIVAYAAARNVTIVPEFCVPGHTMAAAFAYPYLSLSKPTGVATKFVDNTALDPTNEKVYEFISDVLDEYVQLFPSTVIHMGGDEVRYNKEWKGKPEIEKFMKEHNLKSFTDLQVYFTNRVSQIVKSKGRRMMGWNEILGHDLNGERQATAEVGLDRDAIIHFWKGDANFAKGAAELGHQVVNSLHHWTYIDYGYGSISLEKAYTFDPIGVLKGLEEKYHKNVIGSGCQTWSEWIRDFARWQYQAFPRACAFAEVGWTPLKNRNFLDFRNRLKTHMQRMDGCGVQYAKDVVTAISHSDYFNDHKIGTWNAKILDDLKGAEMEIDVSQYVKNAGKYEAIFLYEDGGHGVDLGGASLVANGTEIAVDNHKGFTGAGHRNPVYKFDVKAVPADAKVILKAKVKGSGGNSSKGIIYFKSY